MAPRCRRTGQCCEARFGFAIQFRRRPPVVRLLFQKREWSLQDRLLPPVLQAVDRAFQCLRDPGIRPTRPARTLIAFEQRSRSQHLPPGCPWLINHLRQHTPLVRRQLQHVLLTWHDDTLLSVMPNSSQPPPASPNQFIDELLVWSIFWGAILGRVGARRGLFNDAKAQRGAKTQRGQKGRGNHNGHEGHQGG